mgnify:CR=1 FL=1
MDCTGCHECIRGVCVPVEEGTDPIDECPILCNVKLVCSKKQVCVYKETPLCNCNWISGSCVNDPTTTTTTTLIIEENLREEKEEMEGKEHQLQLLGYSDDDIRMLIELFQSEMEYHHRRHHEEEEEEEEELPTNSNAEYEDWLRILLIIQEIVPAVTLLFLICGILYFRKNMSPIIQSPIKKIA